MEQEGRYNEEGRQQGKRATHHGRAPITEPPPLAKLVEQLARPRILHHEVEMPLVVEVVV